MELLGAVYITLSVAGLQQTMVRGRRVLSFSALCQQHPSTLAILRDELDAGLLESGWPRQFMALGAITGDSQARRPCAADRDSLRKPSRNHPNARTSLPVLLVADLLHPIDRTFVHRLLNSDVAHGCRWGGAVPML